MQADHTLRVDARGPPGIGQLTEGVRLALIDAEPAIEEVVRTLPMAS
jgi:hypothetical protein